ncbi:MAG: DoxX family protein [Gemmatimonadota bacterium]
MLIPELAGLTDLALFLLRLMIAVVFGTSGWAHMTKPGERAESIGMSPPFTLGLGVVEVLGAVSLAAGVVPQIGAILLVGVMLGAIQKKVFVWKTGFWGDQGQGWYYDLLYLVCNLVILTTGGGTIALM